MILPKKLEAKRDELAAEWTKGWNPLADEINSVIALNYKKGFNDCADLLLPEVEKLREALRTKCMCYPSDDPRSGRNLCHACKTIHSWQEFLGEKSEGGDE